MKACKNLFSGLAVATLFFSVPLAAQQQDEPIDSTGFPGDHFSLEGALELFKKADSPEVFEQLLNDKNSKVNNLDLNEDGETDYIRVIDNMEGDAHALVLQVPVSESESQDIAVIEIEKQGPEEAILQIIGDADVFGEEVIVEPFEEAAKDKGKGGPSMDLEFTRIVVNVYLWPSVRFIYRPGYRVWVSPWRWRAYPTWWRPWRPYPLHAFRVHVRPFRPHYHVVTTHRVVTAHRVYTPRRTHSTVVRTRTTTIKATGPRGRSVSKTTRTATVKGKNGGSVTAKRSTTKVKGKNGGGGKKTTTTVKRKRGG